MCDVKVATEEGKIVVWDENNLNFKFISSRRWHLACLLSLRSDCTYIEIFYINFLYIEMCRLSHADVSWLNEFIITVVNIESVLDWFLQSF
jgi:hypothetical protein